MVTFFDRHADLPTPSNMRAREFLKEWRALPTFLHGHYRLFFSKQHRMRGAIDNTAAHSERTLLIPGLGATKLTLTPLRHFLTQRGVTAHHWGLGVNRGNVEQDCERFIGRLERHYAAHAGRINLVGWSMGGVIAREVARQRPDLIQRIFTLGTPVVGGPTYTLAATLWGDTACRQIAEKIQRLDHEQPIHTPLIAFFSKNDGVVSWPACVDRVSLNVSHYEVSASHWAIGFDWSTWEKIHELMTTATTAS